MNTRIDLVQSMASKRRPYVTVEVEPPRGLRVEPLFERLEALRNVDIDSVNISDNPLARVRMDGILFAIELKRRCQLPTIVHLTCRDRNILSLQSALLGADAQGIEGILALTGDPASIGDQPGAKSVYNTNSIGLVRLIAQLNEAKPPSGFRMKEATRFSIGVGFNPNSVNINGEVRKLQKKLDAGAQFIETQPIFDVEQFERLMDTLSIVAPGVPILLGLMPLLSHRSAEYIHNENPRNPALTRAFRWIQVHDL